LLAAKRNGTDCKGVKWRCERRDRWEQENTKSLSVVATYVEGGMSHRTTQGAGGCFCLGFKNPDSPAAFSPSQASLTIQQPVDSKWLKRMEVEWSVRIVERSEAPEAK
jgi:hypothetical protein